VRLAEHLTCSSQAKKLLPCIATKVPCGILSNHRSYVACSTCSVEVIKLLAAGDVESMERLEVWRTVARGEFCEWSLIGAEDGIDYYHQVAGDHQKLMPTFEWQWLENYFKQLHGDIA